VERRALWKQQRQWRGSGSGVSESASVSGGVASEESGCEERMELCLAPGAAASATGRDSWSGC
jgi:hypothetical protein